jgi:hypothetical protein
MAPREGHFKAMKRILGYLRKYTKGRILILDLGFFDHKEHQSNNFDNWREFFPDAEEEKARITIFVDADHAHDVVTRRLVTGIILFINKTPVRWISKRQKMVESSTYGSEMVAARVATNLAVEF